MLSVPREPKRLEEALSELKDLPEGDITDTSPFLEIKILITEPEPSLRNRIDEALKGKSVRFARIAAVTPEKKREDTLITLDELLKISPMEMAEKVFAQQYGEQMPPSMKSLLQEAMQAVETWRAASPNGTFHNSVID
jgi:exonuclease SbcD